MVTYKAVGLKGGVGVDKDSNKEVSPRHKDFLLQNVVSLFFQRQWEVFNLYPNSHPGWEL